MAHRFEEHEQELRRLYVNGNLKQRFSVAMQRVQYLDSGPNLLIAYMSAVEACARALAIAFARRRGDTADAAYERLKRVYVLELLEKHVASALNQTPEELFGEEQWELLGCAAKYRNLLIHECTYLQVGISRDLIATCDAVLRRLKSIAGL